MTFNITGGLMVDGVAQGVTTADMTLYVDAATGNDTNTGLVGFPMKTIQAAINRVPQTVKHNVTINVAAGTYAENLYIQGSVSEYSKKYVIQGPLAAFTPATGPQTGTFTSNDSVHTFTLGAAGWTINDLRGKLLKITSGAKNGSYFGIASNTATTIEAGCAAGVVGNASFEIVTPTVTITKGSNTTSIVITTTNLIPFTTQSLVELKYLSIGGGSASTAIRATNAGAVKVTGCILTPTGSGIISNSSDLFFDGFISCPFPITINSAPVGYCSVDGVLICTGANSAGVALSAFTRCYCSTYQNGCIIQDAAGATLGNGIDFKEGSVAVVTVGGICTVRNCRNGIGVMGGRSLASLYGTQGATLYLTANTTGVYCGNGGSIEVTPLSYLSIVAAGNVDAVKLESSGNTLQILNSSSITGNTGFGIKCATGNAVAHNNIQIGSTVTMNTNTAGDLTLDGTNAITIAELRAAPQKTMVDVNRLNRLAAD